MQAEKVLRAAVLLDQLGKLKSFLKDAPPSSDTMTITFRKGARSKSMTIKDMPSIVRIREVVEGVEENTENTLREMGVNLDSNL